MDCFEIKNNSSLVRVFHAAPQAPNVDVYVNDQMVFSNLAFGDFTRYVYLDEGEYNVSVYLAGQKDRPVINQMVDVPSQQIFTIAATGNLDNLGLLVVPDKVSKSHFKRLFIYALSIRLLVHFPQDDSPTKFGFLPCRVYLFSASFSTRIVSVALYSLSTMQ